MEINKIYEYLNNMLKRVNKRYGLILYYLNEQDTNIIHTIKDEIEGSNVTNKLDSNSGMYKLLHSMLTNGKDEESSAGEELSVMGEGDQDFIQEVYNSIKKVYKMEDKKFIVVEIVYLDEYTKDIYVNKPNLSFLKFLMDYFFLIYYPHRKESLIIMTEQDLLRNIYSLYMTQIKRIALHRDNHCLIKECKEIYIQEVIQEGAWINRIEDIANTTYEGQSPFGQLLLLDGREKELIEYIIEFEGDKNNVRLSDTKRVRKFLEITNEDQDLYIVTDGEKVFGIGKIRWKYIHKNYIFEIKFKGLCKYEVKGVFLKENTQEGKVVRGDNTRSVEISQDIISHHLLRIAYREPSITEEKGDLNKVKKVVEKVFFRENNKNKEQNLDRVEELIIAASNQLHGTMVVITEGAVAQGEVMRLSSQSTRIQKTYIKKEYIKYIAAIDGAIYIDEEGSCYGIGVILDGKAVENQGNASRGARYNAAHKYFQQLQDDNKKCVIVVISEDGMIDIVSEFLEEEYLSKYITSLIQQIIETEDVTKIDDKIQEFIGRYKIAMYDVEVCTAIAGQLFKRAEKEKEENQFLLMRLSGKYYDKAIEEDNFRKNEFSVHVYNKAGIAFSNERSSLEEINKAIEYYERALSLKPESYIIKINKGVTYYQKAKIQKRDFLEEAMLESCSQAEKLLEEGLSHIQKKDADENLRSICIHILIYNNQLQLEYYTNKNMEQCIYKKIDLYLLDKDRKHYLDKIIEDIMIAGIDKGKLTEYMKSKTYLYNIAQEDIRLLLDVLEKTEDISSEADSKKIEE